MTQNPVVSLSTHACLRACPAHRFITTKQYWWSSSVPIFFVPDLKHLRERHLHNIHNVSNAIDNDKPANRWRSGPEFRNFPEHPCAFPCLLRGQSSRHTYNHEFVTPCFVVEPSYGRGSIVKQRSQRKKSGATRIKTVSIACVCAFIKVYNRRVEIGYLCKGGQQMQKNMKLNPLLTIE